MSGSSDIAVGGLTRGVFLLRGALAVAGLYGADAVTPYVSGALAQSGGGDLAVLDFALTLEYVEAAFYKAALAKAGLSPGIKRLATELGDHEQQHVGLISQTITELGGSPAAAPTTTFPLSNEASFLKLAQTLEDTGVSAYNGAAATIRSPDVLAAAGSIVQVEARHAGAIRLRAGTAPAPAAFDPAITQAQAQAAVRPYVK